MHNFIHEFERLFMDNIPYEVITILATDSEVNFFQLPAMCNFIIVY